MNDSEEEQKKIDPNTSYPILPEKPIKEDDIMEGKNKKKKKIK